MQNGGILNARVSAEEAGGERGRWSLTEMIDSEIILKQSGEFVTRSSARQPKARGQRNDMGRYEVRRRCSRSFQFKC